MATTLNRLVLGDALKPASRDVLTRWLVGCKTGDARLRAGVPHSWRTGDKTGTGRHGTANDIGILWPPSLKPVIVTVYITGSDATAETQSTAIAAVARTVVQTVKLLAPSSHLSHDFAGAG